MAPLSQYALRIVFFLVLSCNWTIPPPASLIKLITNRTMTRQSLSSRNFNEQGRAKSSISASPTLRKAL